MIIDYIVNENKYIVKHRIVQIIGVTIKDRDRVWLEGLWDFGALELGLSSVVVGAVN